MLHRPSRHHLHPPPRRATGDGVGHRHQRRVQGVGHAPNGLVAWRWAVMGENLEICLMWVAYFENDFMVIEPLFWWWLIWWLNHYFDGDFMVIFWWLNHYFDGVFMVILWWLNHYFDGDVSRDD